MVKGELEGEVKTGEFHPDNAARFPLGFNCRFEEEEVEITVAGMREIAVKIGGRKAFTGLPSDDLPRSSGPVAMP